MRRFLVFSAVAGLCALAPTAGYADGADAMGESYRATVVGGGVASDGVGLAGRAGGPASGTITISGIPGGAEVVRAFLYWSILAGEDPAVVMDGQNLVGGQIGRSPDPCWQNLHTVDPSQDSRSYRADVTSIVAGNGAHTISGVGGNGGLSGEGTGASLFVVYEDPSADFQATIILNDGSITGGLPGAHRETISHTFGSLPTSSPLLGASLHVGIGDGQPEFGEGRMTLGDEEVLPAGSIDGSDGPSWDDKTLAVPASLFGSGRLTLENRIETDYDCIVWVYGALVLQQERSALPPPSVAILSPAAGAVLNTSTVTITGASTGASSIRLSEGPQTLATTGVDQQGTWSAQLQLGDGLHTIAAAALDQANNPVALTTVQFTVSAGGPPSGPVRIVSPAHNSVLTFTSVPFNGTATGAASVRLTEGSATLATAGVSGGNWSAGPFTFAEGAHEVTAVPLDAGGNPAGAWTFVRFGVDTAAPSISMAEADFPSPPVGNIQINVGNAHIHGSASDGLAVAGVVVSYRELGAAEWRIVEASCGGCMPSFCMWCGNAIVQWWADLEDLEGPGVYEVEATAYDLAGRSSTTVTRLLVELFGDGGPGGLFGEGPPTCWGPLEGSPVCFDPFEGGPFSPESPLCVGPVKDMLCET